jgi:hypothetical protein
MTRRVAVLALLAALFAAAPAGAALPPIRHVFVIVLENKDYAATFGPSSPAPFLARTLPSQGQLLRQYYGTAHHSLPNYIAMISGQSPNIQTQADCQFYTEMLPGVIGADGQALGQGCVHPSTVKTVADQLEAKGLSWRGYMQDMGTPCRHPALNAHDDTQTAKPGDQYAARHNPFVYFHSIIDSPTCGRNDVPLEQLTADLRSPATTPNFSMIVPNLCEDGHDEPCVDGRPGGLAQIDGFLRRWVPPIVASRAFRDDGLLIVTFDEAEHDASACCNEPVGPNTPNNGGETPGDGGGRVGAVMLSRFIARGTVNDTPYNHYSLLRSVEDLFGLDHLGYAARADLRPFGDDVYNGQR